MSSTTPTNQLTGEYNLEETADVAGQLFDPKRDKDAYQAAVCLLVAGFIGPGAKKVYAEVKKIGISRSDVRRYAKNLYENGVWKQGRVFADWADPQNGKLAFMFDVLCAEGITKRVPLKTREGYAVVQKSQFTNRRI